MTLTEESDDVLLQRSGIGDRAAFGLIYDRHVRAVYWQAFGVVRDPDTAEEVCQEAFITLWRKVRSVHLVDDSALPWLMVTARYLALNARRRRRREADHAAPLHPDVADRDADVATTVEAAEVQRQIDAAVGGLTALDRRLYDLCIAGEHSYEAAARELGVGHGTVRNRLSRLRSRLRADLHALRETS